MQPLKFHPILKQTLWGGERILPFKRLDTDLRRVGESWEISGVAGAESVVAEGPYAGQTLSDLIARFGADLVGKKNFARFGTEFPLLVKFIDAREDLSIQVHPNDELAHRRHNRNGKNEMWYVLDAEPDTSLLAGLSQSITPEEYETRLGNRTLTEVLNRYRISPGDVFHLPAGRIHSIGRGALIVEIQQTSDITYRIYDYDRLDSNGRPRELHTALAREAIDYEDTHDALVRYPRHRNQEIPLVSSPYFTTSLYEITQQMRLNRNSADSFLVLVFLTGEGHLTDNEGNTQPIRQGETLLVPATTEWVEVIPASDSLRVLTSCIE